MPFSNKSVQKYVAKHDTTKKKVIVEEMIDLLPVLKKYKNQTQKALDVYKKAIELRQKYYSLGGRNFEKYVEINLDELKIKYKTQVSIDEKGVIFQMIGQKLKNKEYKFLARIDFVISPKKRVFPKLGQHISELIVIEAALGANGMDEGQENHPFYVLLSHSGNGLSRHCSLQTNRETLYNLGRL